MKNIIETIDSVLINETISFVKNQIGVDLVLCDYFKGIKYHKGNKYFNVVFEKRCSESKEYQVLESFAKRTGLIKIEPNGLSRAALYPVFLKNKTLKAGKKL